MTPRRAPKVTVMMPVHNAGRYLAASIRSVLKQNFPDYELIIYDDGSSDESYSIAEEFRGRDSRIKLLRSKTNRGVSYARNRILEAAEGEYLAPQDADDLMMQNRLRDLSRFLDSHPRVGVVFGSVCWLWRGNERFLHPWVRTSEGREEIRKSQYVRAFPWFHHGASLFRRNLAVKIGGYDERLKTSEDLELFFRLFKKTRFFYLDHLYYIYRYTRRGISARHHVAVTRRRRRFENLSRCQILKTGPFRLRFFFEKSGFNPLENGIFLNGKLKTRSELISSNRKWDITLQIKKTTGRENWLELEILLPEIGKLRERGFFASVDRFFPKATIHCLDDRRGKRPGEKEFEEYFMKPISTILGRFDTAWLRGSLVSKKGKGVLLFDEAGSNGGKAVIQFLQGGYEYLANGHFPLRIIRNAALGYSFLTRICIGPCAGRQIFRLGNVIWDQGQKKYYLEPNQTRGACLIKTVLFLRRAEGISVKRLTTAGFKRKLLKENQSNSESLSQAIPFLLRQAAGYEAALNDGERPGLFERLSDEKVL